jgi:1,4-alpha-glucan branching enzyme
MLKKKFLKTKCKVTFEAPASIAEGATNIYLVGDFNEWDERSTLMEKKDEKKKGTKFTITLDLDLGREYQYRFLVDGKRWENDWDADKYVPNPFSGDNSVVNTNANGTGS